jgi:hypothetical protein
VIEDPAKLVMTGTAVLCTLDEASVVTAADDPALCTAEVTGVGEESAPPAMLSS